MFKVFRFVYFSTCWFAKFFNIVNIVTIKLERKIIFCGTLTHSLMFYFWTLPIILCTKEEKNYFLHILSKTHYFYKSYAVVDFISFKYSQISIYLIAGFTFQCKPFMICRSLFLWKLSSKIRRRERKHCICKWLT